MSDSRRPLRAALIGTGRISEEHLRFLASSPAAELVGVCDLSPAMAEHAASRFPRRDGRRAAIFTDATLLLAELRPDVVHLLTPAQTHVRLAEEALDAGAHVIVEKPIALDNAAFRALWERARSRGRTIVEDHNYRFNEPILRIEAMRAAGALGAVREVEVRLGLDVRAGGRYADRDLPSPSHRLPAGALHEFLTHLCYLAQRFTPESASAPRIAAEWSKHGSDALFRWDDLDALVIEGDVHARLRFTSHALPETFTVIVRGSRGWVETDLFQPYLRTVVPRSLGKQLSPLANQIANGGSLLRAGVVGLRNKVMQKTPLEGMRVFLQRTYEALADGSEPPVTFADMDRASRLLDALLQRSHAEPRSE